MGNINMTSVYDITGEIIAKMASDIDDEVFRQVAAKKGYSRCDRDALLELADEIEDARHDGKPYGDYELYRWQRRIREACGVEA